MRWFKEHKIFSTVAAIVVILILIIVKSYANMGMTSFVGSGVQKIASFVGKPFVFVADGVGSAVTGIFDYKDLQTENEKLKAENEKLKQRNNNLTMSKNELKELKELAKIFDYEAFEGIDDIVAANIIAVDNSMIYKEFTVDAGTSKGIGAEDIVVNSDGIVGIVKEANKNTAKISSILETNNNISFMLKKNSKVKGVIKGNGSKTLEGYLMNSDANVVEGDVIVTSGVGKYPKGITIGKVSEVEYDSDSQLKRIKVKPGADFTTMQKVAIIK